jgi:hypothetical protein
MNARPRFRLMPVPKRARAESLTRRLVLGMFVSLDGFVSSGLHQGWGGEIGFANVQKHHGALGVPRTGGDGGMGLYCCNGLAKGEVVWAERKEAGDFSELDNAVPRSREWIEALPPASKKIYCRYMHKTGENEFQSLAEFNEMPIEEYPNVRIIDISNYMNHSCSPTCWFVDGGEEYTKVMVAARDLNFDGYMLDHVEIHHCDYNWKTFIEVYLEDYHVEAFHPGLGQFVSCNDLRWEMGDGYSVQTVGVNAALKKSGSATYQKWHDEVLRYNGGQAPKYGAIWLTIYPNIMVEWYPNVLVVSTVWPNGPQKTTNVVEFYYPEEIVLFERSFIDAERAAYMETCAEDDEIALRMDAGRKILLDRGVNEVGPYQSPMEDGMQHFHEWYRSQIAL